MMYGNDKAFPGANSGGGLTKREYFAAMALQGLLAGGAKAEHIPDVAVLYADELINSLNEDERTEMANERFDPEYDGDPAEDEVPPDEDDDDAVPEDDERRCLSCGCVKSADDQESGHDFCFSCFQDHND